MCLASAGTLTEPAAPMAMIFSSEITMVWSGLAAAPVPSITRTCSSTIAPAGTLMKSLTEDCCGWAEHKAAQQITSKTADKRRMARASVILSTKQHKRGWKTMQGWECLQLDIFNWKFGSIGLTLLLVENEDNSRSMT